MVEEVEEIKMVVMEEMVKMERVLKEKNLKGGFLILVSGNLIKLGTI